MNPDAHKTRVAFLGLGIMGSGMAARILNAGFDLTVYNRNSDKTAPLKAAGAKVAATPRDAARGAAIVISMLADDPASRALWLGDHGALAGAAPGTIVVESSTVTPDWVKELAAAAAGKKCAFIDAPVTGSKMHAAAGELNFIVGGESATLDKARPVLAVMSRSITHVGPVGSGAQLKLINNFLCGAQAASLAEGMALIERSGLDRAKALEAILGGAPGSPLLKTLAGRMTTADFRPNFLLRLMAKDLDYAHRAGREHGVELTTAVAARAVFQRAIAAGNGEDDMSAIIEQFRHK